MHTSLIPALGRLRQEDHEFEGSWATREPVSHKIKAISLWDSACLMYERLWVLSSTLKEIKAHIRKRESVKEEGEIAEEGQENGERKEEERLEILNSLPMKLRATTNPCSVMEA